MGGRQISMVEGIGDEGAGVGQCLARSSDSPDRQPCSVVLLPNHKTNTSSSTALSDILIHITSGSI